MTTAAMTPAARLDAITRATEIVRLDDAHDAAEQAFEPYAECEWDKVPPAGQRAFLVRNDTRNRRDEYVERHGAVVARALVACVPMLTEIRKCVEAGIREGDRLEHEEMRWSAREKYRDTLAAVLAACDRANADATARVAGGKGT